MAVHDDLEKLDHDSWNRLQEIVERFENDCAASFPRPLKAYLPPTSNPLREPVLIELVRTDLELRWRKGRGVLVDHYLKRFPELKVSKWLPALLHDEYSIRNQFGDKPDIAQYRARFPDLFERMQNVATNFGSSARSSSPLAPPKPERPRTVKEKPKQRRSRAAASNTLEQVGASMAGRFKMIRKLGSGGFGEVWEALGPGGVPVAVKRTLCSISNEAIEREKGSLDLICSGNLRHPFLLQVFGWWIEDGQLHIAMELADESLDQRLKAMRARGLPGLPISFLKQIFLDAADALDYLNHKKNILHRDVKPANMLLMADRLKLCDFGLSRMTEHLAIVSGRTRGAGTPVFIAPEIVNGVQSRHSDQYSLAATYYMLRTGRPIFRGNAHEIRKQHASAAPKLTDDILTDREKAALLRSLNKEPEDRYESSMELVQALIASVECDAETSLPMEYESTLEQDDFGGGPRKKRKDLFAQQRDPSDLEPHEHEGLQISRIRHTVIPDPSLESDVPAETHDSDIEADLPVNKGGSNTEDQQDDRNETMVSDGSGLGPEDPENRDGIPTLMDLPPRNRQENPSDMVTRIRPADPIEDVSQIGQLRKPPDVEWDNDESAEPIPTAPLNNQKKDRALDDFAMDGRNPPLNVEETAHHVPASPLRTDFEDDYDDSEEPVFGSPVPQPPPPDPERQSPEPERVPPVDVPIAPPVGGTQVLENNWQGSELPPTAPSRSPLQKKKESKPIPLPWKQRSVTGMVAPPPPPTIEQNDGEVSFTSSNESSMGWLTMIVTAVLVALATFIVGMFMDSTDSSTSKPPPKAPAKSGP